MNYITRTAVLKWQIKIDIGESLFKFCYQFQVDSGFHARMYPLVQSNLWYLLY